MRELGSGFQVQVVAPLHDHRAGAGRAADGCANRRTLGAAGHGADHRANRRADARAGRRARRLAVVLTHVGVLDLQRVAVRRPYALDDAVEVSRPPVAEADAIEVERHVRAPGHTARAIHGQQPAVDPRALELAGRHDGQRERVLRARLPRAQPVVERGHDFGAVRHVSRAAPAPARVAAVARPRRAVVGRSGSRRSSTCRGARRSTRGRRRSATPPAGSGRRG